MTTQEIELCQQIAGTIQTAIIAKDGPSYTLAESACRTTVAFEAARRIVENSVSAGTPLDAIRHNLARLQSPVTYEI